MAHSMHWAAAGALLLAAVGFAALGRWQLERAEFHRAMVADFEAATLLPPLEQPVADVEDEDEDEDEDFRYRTIRLRGHYVPESQVLLENMTSHGVAGYQVLTPFRVDGDALVDGAGHAGDQGLVIVNRGWLPAPLDRSILPDVGIAAADEVVVSGRVDRLPRAALELEAPATATHLPVTVLSFPDFAAIEAVLGAPVHHFQLLLDAEAPEGFVREWAPPADRANRNIAYAVQWFGLGLLALVISIGVAIKGHRGVPETAA